MNKKKFIMPSILAVILAISLPTFAYLRTQSDVKTNNFYPGVLSAPIYENDKDTTEAPGGTNNITYADDTAVKKVQVKNADTAHEVDAYIRVMLVPIFRNADGDSIAGSVPSLKPVENAITIAAPMGGTVTLNLNTDWNTNWYYYNGYFYCKKIVHPNELTAVLLENVTVTDPKLWNTFNLEVLSDSIQAESRAAAEEWGEIAKLLEQYQ